MAHIHHPSRFPGEYLSPPSKAVPQGEMIDLYRNIKFFDKVPRDKFMFIFCLFSGGENTDLYLNINFFIKF